MSLLDAPPGVRLPRVEGLGITYRNGLMNVVLSKIRPCDERSVIKRIDNALKGYRTHLAKVEDSRDRCVTFHSSPPAPAGSNGKTAGDIAREEPAGILCEAVHATLLGRQQLATIFRSHGFGLCHVFGSIDQILSHQIILGDIPSPVDPLPFKVLSQKDPDGFFSRATGSDLTGSSLGAPLLTICQLEVSGLLRCVSAANITLPLLLAIDECLTDCAPGRLRGLVLNTFGWSDYTLLLRTYDIETALYCVDRLRRLTLGGIRDAWEVAISYSSSADSGKSQIGALVGRLKRLLDPFGPAREAPPDFFPSNMPFFSASTSVPGLLWPLVDLHLKAAIAGKEANLGQSMGRAEAYFMLSVPAGHDYNVENVLAGELRKQEGIKGAGHLETPHTTLGYFDRIIPATKLCSSKDEDDFVSFSELVAKFYHLRWRLAGEPGTPDCPWLVAPDDDRSRGFIQNMVLLMQGHSEALPPEKNAALAKATNHEWERFVFEAFGGTRLTEKKSEFISLMKNCGITRSLRSSFLHIVSLWRRELEDAQESVPMVELADSFITWINALVASLKNGENAPADIEELIRFFTQPFAQAVLQRTLTGYHMSEYTDLNSDFKGGLSRILTGIDGLVKAALSLVGPPFQAGCLTLVGQGRTATASIKKVFLDWKSEASEEYLCSVLSIDYPQLAHPLCISTVLHELLHIVVASRDFLQALKKCGGDDELCRRLSGERGTEKERLVDVRIEEMLVEHLLAWLTFPEEPELYARTAMVQIVLHPEFWSNAEKENKWALAEHTARVYVVSRLLAAPEEMDRPKTLLLDFDDWWRQNVDRLFASKDSSELKSAVKNAIADWMCSPVIRGFLALIHAVPSTFFTGLTSKEVLGSNVPRRAEFLRGLRDTQNKYRQEVSRILDAPRFEGIHFVFYDSNDDLPRCLQVRRMESLIGYLTLIGAFYRSLDRLLCEEGEAPLLLRRKGSSILFDESSASSQYLLDPLSGTLFTIGSEAHAHYLSLRLAFLGSMWHLAEVMKLSGMIATKDIVRFTRQDCAFLPSKNLLPSDLAEL